MHYFFSSKHPSITMDTPQTILNMELTSQTTPDPAYEIFPREAGRNASPVQTHQPAQVPVQNTPSYESLADSVQQATLYAGPYIGTHKTHDEKVIELKNTGAVITYLEGSLF